MDLCEFEASLIYKFQDRIQSYREILFRQNEKQTDKNSPHWPGSSYAVWAVLKLKIYLSLPPKCLDYRHVLPHQLTIKLFNWNLSDKKHLGMIVHAYIPSVKEAEARGNSTTSLGLA